MLGVCVFRVQLKEGSSQLPITGFLSFEEKRE
jgi:hypothetical protein